MKKISVLIAIIVLSYGCAVKTARINSSLNIDNAVTAAKENTPNLCSYRGRISVTINAERTVSFYGLLNKKCNDDALINILGAMNSPIAKITYQDKKVSVETPSKEDTMEIQRLADNYVFHIVNFFKTPLDIPDTESYSLSFASDAYVFSRGISDKIFADENFRLFKYISGHIKTEYVWSGDFLKEISVSSDNGAVSVKFLNKNGWSDK